jgi:CheY-like chemotaxis protein
MIILVADDDPRDLAEMVSVVRNADPEAQILEACSGREAIQVMRDHPGVDLALVDLYMYPGTGREAAAFAESRGIRAQVVSNSTPLSKYATENTASKDDMEDHILLWLHPAPAPAPERRKRRTTWRLLGVGA